MGEVNMNYSCIELASLSAHTLITKYYRSDMLCVRFLELHNHRLSRCVSQVFFFVFLYVFFFLPST